MLENSRSKCEKTPWTRARRSLLCFLMLLLLMGTLMLSFHISKPPLSWSLNYWRTTTWPTKSYVTATSLHKSPDVLPATQCYFVAYPHRYQFILDEPDRCQQQSPFLVLMIPVAPQNKEARDAIRQTWGKETIVLGQVVSHYFLLGRAKEGDEAEPLKEQVLQESQEHHDLLQYDFLDSYMNLTIKTMLMFEWLNSHCPNTSYAMKIDSDMFLNVHNLMDLVLKAPDHLYMTGLVARGAAVLRDPNSKWFLPVEVFPESQYPPYALGLGYVFSLDLAQKILDASKHVKAVYIEDVYVGLCMRHAGMAVTNPPNGGLFQASLPYFLRSCYWGSVITTILENPKKLLDIWGKYRTQIQNGC